MKVRDSVFDLLRNAGMTTIFGNPGSTEIPMLDAIPADFRYVLGLQESIVVGMADGFAQASRSPTLVSLHSAAGVGHALGAVFTASKNQSPLVVIAGQQVRSMLIHEPYLAASEATFFPQPHVKWACEPARAQDVPAALARAIYVATLPPQGPTFLSVPMDDWDQSAEPIALRRLSRTVVGEPELLNEIARTLAQSQSPVFVVGPEVARDEAWNEVVALAEKHSAPVWESPRSSRNSFPEHHALFAGFLPISRQDVAACLAGHDIVLVLGAPVFLYHVEGYGGILPPGAQAYQLTQDPDSAACAATGTSVLTNLKLGAAALLAGPVSRQRVSPKKRSLPTPLGGTPLTSAYVCQEMATLLRPSDVIVEEAPSARLVMQRYLPMTEPDQFYTCASGGLGHGLPAAIGIALAQPERRVIALLGDGSSMYSIQGLFTAARLAVPVLFVILNNGSYRSLVEFGGYGAADLPHWARLGGMDFVMIAEGFGIQAHLVREAKELAPTLESALRARHTALVEIAVVDEVTGASTKPIAIAHARPCPK